MDNEESCRLREEEEWRLLNQQYLKGFTAAKRQMADALDEAREAGRREDNAWLFLLIGMVAGMALTAGLSSHPLLLIGIGLGWGTVICWLMLRGREVSGK